VAKNEKPWWEQDAEDELRYAAMREPEAEAEEKESPPEVPVRDTRAAGISELRKRYRSVQRREKQLADARTELYARAAQLSDQEGWSVRRIAQAMSVTNKTAHEWIKAGRRPS
jgi:DNA-directed RNA polymerase specialized sigma24 family protein